MARRTIRKIPLKKLGKLSEDIRNLMKKKTKYDAAEQLVHDLCSYNSRYAKFEKYPFFTKRVKQITGNLSTKTENNNPCNETNEADLPYNGGGSLSSLGFDTSSDGSPEVKNHFDDEASMSNETTIHDNNLKQELDVMSSMLMNGYLQQLKESGQKMEVESRELDLVNVKGKKATMVGDGSTTVKNNDISCGSDGNQSSKGPMFKDLGGMSQLIQDLKIDVVFPFIEPDMLQLLGVEPLTGILLHGPPGCGKTRLAHAIANECNVPFYSSSATELVSGDPEEKISDLFSKAYRTAPSIIFIDEIDAMASKREDLQRETDRRIVTQLMTCMNTVKRTWNDIANSESCHGKAGYVLVIGATNRPDAIDRALRRPGRFDREFFVGVPDENARIEILPLVTGKLKLDDSVDFRKIARSTPGFVGADLDAVAKMAGRLAVRRILLERQIKLTKELVSEEKSKELVSEEKSKDWSKLPLSDEEKEKLCVTMDDFEKATKLIQPSTKREGFSAIPNVTWDDVGGLSSLREELNRDIVRRIKYPEACQAVKLDLDVGFMLYGPPGCGKTLIAKAVANEAGASFMYIKGPELLSKFVGDSEATVRKIFKRAIMCTPCILFFDEMDAITSQRGSESRQVAGSVLAQLLVMLDGAEQRKGVYVIGTTNRPEVVDSAMLRPGRFGKHLYVKLPTSEERGMILKALGRNKPIDANVNLMEIGSGSACENFSGADLSNLMYEASQNALDDMLTLDSSFHDRSPIIKKSNFCRALEKVSPSVSVEDIQNLERWSLRSKNTAESRIQ